MAWKDWRERLFSGLLTLQETFSKWPFLLTAVDGLGVGDAVLASGWVWDRSPSCLL